MRRIVNGERMARKNPTTPDATRTSDGEERRRQVNIDPDLVRKGGMVAAHEGVTFPDYINNVLRPIVEADLLRVLDEMGLGKTPPAK